MFLFEILRKLKKKINLLSIFRNLHIHYLQLQFPISYAKEIIIENILQLHLVHWNKSKYRSFAEAADKDDGLAVLGFFTKVNKRLVGVYHIGILFVP